MKKATFVRHWPHGTSKATAAAIIIEVEEPIAFLDITFIPKQPTEMQSRFLAAVATRFPGFNRVSVYPCDAEGNAKTIVPFAEKKGTLSIREVMAEAGYDVSSWPEEIK